MYIKNYKQQLCNVSFLYAPIHVPGVHFCQKYASASHQMPANQKSIQIRTYYYLENAHIVTNTVLKEGYIMGHNLLTHASLGHRY